MSEKLRMDKQASIDELGSWVVVRFDVAGLIPVSGVGFEGVEFKGLNVNRA